MSTTSREVATRTKYEGIPSTISAKTNAKDREPNGSYRHHDLKLIFACLTTGHQGISTRSIHASELIFITSTVIFTTHY